MKYKNNEIAINIKKTGSKQEKIKTDFPFLIILYKEHIRL